MTRPTETSLLQNASTLKTLREALSSHMELSKYFLGMHALFDGEVVQVNIDLSPCPVDFSDCLDLV